MAEITLVEAVNLALARAMAEDDGVLVLGEDVGVNGGVFRASDGLQARFGDSRVRDTPLSEAFGLADEVLFHATRGISDLISVPGLVNLDFADVKSVVLMVLFNQPRPEPNYPSMQDLTFDTEQDYRH